LDWHGPSTQDALSTIDSLHNILSSQEEWYDWNIQKDTKVLVIGHSNGGQGAWYFAGRFPDRVVGAAPAAGYIKSQAYVPLSLARSGHYMDPFLRAILDTSLTPDDNDLFLSTLVDTPILAIHGGKDENVPVWHTREMFSVLKTLRVDANISYKEDQGQSHWYPSVFDNNIVQEWIKSTLDAEAQISHHSRFTLTVAIPRDSGSLHGWRIESLQVPGRLGQLTVHKKDGLEVHVTTRNVRVLSISNPYFAYEKEDPHSVAHIVIDSQRLPLSLPLSESEAVSRFVLNGSSWQTQTDFTTALIQPSGRLSNILTSSGPLTFVIPDKDIAVALSGALRLSHDLDVYHKLDTEIINASEALERVKSHTLGHGNIVTLGKNNELTATLASQQLSQAAFQLKEGNVYVHDQKLGERTAALFLQPHPTYSDALVLAIHSEDEADFEKALRLFPIRTGVTVPDWVLVGKDSDVVGAAGIQGAGVWGNDWAYSEVMSWH